MDGQARDTTYQEKLTMFPMGYARLIVIIVLSGSALWTQQWAAPVNIPLKNWTAPNLWSPPAGVRAQGAASSTGGGTPAVGATSPFQFVAIMPCRLMDTRAG